ncbi:hypothetical protein EBZ80_24790 [bacterium]|nr:hypothetical protein [bacterium]
MNPNITWEIVAANPEKPWNWYWLSRNPNITWEIVAANPDKPWSWQWLSASTFNPPITEAFKKKKAKEVADLCREGIMKYCWNPERPMKLCSRGLRLGRRLSSRSGQQIVVL